MKKNIREKNIRGGRGENGSEGIPSLLE